MITALNYAIWVLNTPCNHNLSRVKLREVCLFTFQISFVPLCSVRSFCLIAFSHSPLCSFDSFEILCLFVQLEKRE